jgi:tetratricopeptide (TPR) repeat protein
MRLADYEAWMALEESEKHRLISDANDARLTVEATQEVMHVMALEQYNKLLVVQVNWHARQVIRRGEVDQALVDLDEAILDMASTYNKIAGVNVTLCKYELAGFNFRACLDIQIKVLGANNLDVASTYYMIAGLYYMQKKYELSLEIYGKCLAIRIAVLGENHVYVLYTQNAIFCATRAKEELGDVRASEASIRAGASIRATHAMDEFDKLIASPLQFGGLP